MIDSRPNPLSRRQALRQILAASLCSPLSALLPHFGLQAQSTAPLATTSAMPILSAEDDQFLNDIEKASFLFFWEEGNPKTGMVKDRCNLHFPDRKEASSIAATGFGLTALCVADQRVYT